MGVVMVFILGVLKSSASSTHARTPPAPPIRQLTYVSDLQFVPEPEPAEPVWSPD
jgi:hypothetical protein